MALVHFDNPQTLRAGLVSEHCNEPDNAATKYRQETEHTPGRLP